MLKDQLKPRLPEAAESESGPVARPGVVKALVRAYFSVVRKTFCDLVPKIVMTHVVHKVRCCVGISQCVRYLALRGRDD